MPLVFDTPQKASQWLNQIDRNQKSIGFVPTMGALHDGHLSLLRQARKDNDIVCASVFVNPLQFNNPDDLEKYPRDLDNDISLLQSNGCDMVFTGTLQDFFPKMVNQKDIELEDPGFYAHGLEGAFRPGHFAGVRTIVRRLFQTLGPCKAYFGQKDFQQTLVVKELAKQMGYPEIIVCPTIREANGLAMSSRNQRLSEQQRQIAGKIFSALSKACRAWEQGERDATRLMGLMHEELSHPEIKIEYAQLREPDNWTAEALSGELQTPPQALIAVNIGGVRLIDNCNLGARLNLNNLL